LKTPKLYFIAVTLAAVLFSACLVNPQKERFDLNQSVGKITVNDVDIQVKFAPVALVAGKIEARAQRPTLEVSFLSRNAAPVNLVFKLSNMRHDALPTASTGTVTAGPKPGVVEWAVTIAAGASVGATVANFTGGGAYRFGVVGDLHYRDSTATLIAESAKTRALDFFILVGDFINQPNSDEYNWALSLSEKFAGPVYAAYGNHEGFRDGYMNFYRRLFGTTNFSFTHKGDFFLVLDSADQSISREIFRYAESELGASGSGLKMMFMHVPPFDESGMRNNSFNSRFQAARFLNMALDHGVDIVFAGHIHSYQDFYVDAIRNVIVGTGGGRPEQFDGVGIRYAILHSNAAGGYELETVDLGPD
jgi:predicted phosphodiesterase